MTASHRDRIPLLSRILRAASDAPMQRLPEGTRVDEAEAEWLIAIGLAPLAHRLRPQDGYRTDARTAARLHGAELTARALTDDLRQDVRVLLDRLATEGMRPAPLKGIVFADSYYPEPHLRTMGDVDLLLRPDEIEAARLVLEALGFVEPPTPWRPGHHAPPLHHVSQGVWVELHHALRPTACPGATEAPFDPESVAVDLDTASWTPDGAPRLSPELDLALIAVGWCLDLKIRFGQTSAQRPLVDAARLLASVGEDLDCDRITGWSERTYTGACLTVLLTYLDRHGAYRGPDGLHRRVRAAQHFVSATTLAAIHGVLDRHLLGPYRAGRRAPSPAIGRIVDTLIAPRAPWRSMVAVPVNVAFPASDPRRFRPGTLLRRVRRLLSKDG